MLFNIHILHTQGERRRSTIVEGTTIEKHAHTHTRGKGRNAHIVERVPQLLINMLTHTHTKGAGVRLLLLKGTFTHKNQA
jgi:hypothetical protein